MPISILRALSASAGAAALLVPLLGAAAPGSTAPSAGARERVLVQVRSRADARAVSGEQQRGGGRIRHLYTSVLDGFSADLPAAAITALRHNPKVAAVTPVQRMRATDTQSSAPWNLDRIDQRGAALNKAYGFDSTGSGVTAYVVDTGILFSHTQFGGRASSGYDFVDSDSDATDCDGHGTHVAGTIGGSTYGVAKGVRLVGVRVLDCDGWGWDDDIIAGLDWVASNAHKPAVVNMSIGGSPDSFIDGAVGRVTSAGIPVVVSAGNDDADACDQSPAEAPSALTVGAVDSNGWRARFSNWGPCVDLFAPGVNVVSSVIGSNTATASYDGTSMASPHVAGAVARYLQGNPGASVAQVTASILGNATQGAVSDAESAHSGLLYVPPATVRTADDAVGVTAYQASSSTAVLQWSPPVNTGSGFITGYTVGRDGTDRSGNGAWSTTVSASARSFTLTNLAAGRTYNLFVKPVTTAGAGDPTTVAVPIATTSVVNAPSGVGATETAAGTAVLRWNPPTSLAGRTVTGYRITRPASGATPALSTTVAATARSYTFTGLPVGGRYDLLVQAVTAVGAGPASRATWTMRPFVAAPVTVTAVQVSAGTARLSWQPPTVVGQPIIGYRVYRDGTDSAGRGPWSAVLTAGARSVTFTSLVPGRTYTLSVQAETASTLGVPASPRAAITY